MFKWKRRSEADAAVANVDYAARETELRSKLDRERAELAEIETAFAELSTDLYRHGTPDSAKDFQRAVDAQQATVGRIQARECAIPIEAS